MANPKKEKQKAIALDISGAILILILIAITIWLFDALINDGDSGVITFMFGGMFALFYANIAITLSILFATSALNKSKVLCQFGYSRFRWGWLSVITMILYPIVIVGGFVLNALRW